MSYIFERVRFVESTKGAADFDAQLKKYLDDAHGFSQPRELVSLQQIDTLSDWSDPKVKKGEIPPPIVGIEVIMTWRTHRIRSTEQ